MRRTVARQIDIEEIRRILDETPAPEPPAQWTGAHVGERMVEAFRVLARLPERVGPRQYRASTAFLTGLGLEFADAVAREETRDKRAFGWSRVRPSAAEISRMEHAFDWTRRYLADDRLAHGALLAWAHATAWKRSPHWFIKREGLTRQSFRQARHRAAYTIAARLHRARVPVE